MRRLPTWRAMLPVCLTILILNVEIADCLAGDGPHPALSHDEAAQLFTRQIGPLLRKKCLGCHGDGKELEGDLDLRSRQAMLRGGATEEPALAPGDPEKSLLFQAVLRTGDLAMPPKERNRLSEDEIESLQHWIAAGAPWPEADEPTPPTGTWDAADGVALATSGGLSPDWDARRYAPEYLWAYRPLKRPDVPSLEPLGRSDGQLPHEHGQPLRRRSGDRRLGELRTGD